MALNKRKDDRRQRGELCAAGGRQIEERLQQTITIPAVLFAGLRKAFTFRQLSEQITGQPESTLGERPADEDKMSRRLLIAHQRMVVGQIRVQRRVEVLQPVLFAIVDLEQFVVDLRELAVQALDRSIQQTDSEE